MDKYRILYLLNQNRDNCSTPVEAKELEIFLANPENKDMVVDVIAEYFSTTEMPSFDEKLLQYLPKVFAIDKVPENEPGSIVIPQAHRIHFLKTAWFRYAAAIVLVFGMAAYLFYSKQNSKKAVIVQELNKEAGSDKAILTLSDGRKILLNDSVRENISDGSISIEKSNGILTYNAALTSKADVTSYNIMNTPRGGQYQLVLPDGSKVWMNSASSLKYPTIFTDKERKVELSGEAYFEIKQNKKTPFIVKTQKAEVTVLGTEFNINSFEDEPYFSTTLISGSVKVSTADNAKVILPGQQAQLSNSEPDVFRIKNDVDISQVVAWQKGIFRFKDVSLDIIARQLSRWYDVEIVVGSNNKAVKLSGGIAKKTPLRTVLKNLEANGVTNKWQNNTITLISN